MCAWRQRGFDENVLILTSLPIELPIQYFRLLKTLSCWFSLILMLNTLRIFLAHAKGPETFQ